MTNERSQEMEIALSEQAIRRMADAELSTAARVGYVALLLTTLLMAVAMGSLWLTEPALALRTQIAFATLVAINLSWAIFSSWVLTRRRVQLSRHRIVAGRMAVTFTAVFVVGALTMGYVVGGRAPAAAAGVGLLMLGAAIAMLVHAHRAHAALIERRRVLEHEMSGFGGARGQR
jgi:hypothetical protein